MIKIMYTSTFVIKVPADQTHHRYQVTPSQEFGLDHLGLLSAVCQLLYCDKHNPMRLDGE